MPSFDFRQGISCVSTVVTDGVSALHKCAELGSNRVNMLHSDHFTTNGLEGFARGQNSTFINANWPYNKIRTRHVIHVCLAIEGAPVSLGIVGAEPRDADAADGEAGLAAEAPLWCCIGLAQLHAASADRSHDLTSLEEQSRHHKGHKKLLYGFGTLIKANSKISTVI